MKFHVSFHHHPQFTSHSSTTARLISISISRQIGLMKTVKNLFTLRMFVMRKRICGSIDDGLKFVLSLSVSGDCWVDGQQQQQHQQQMLRSRFFNFHSSKLQIAANRNAATAAVIIVEFLLCALRNCCSSLP